MTAQMFLVILMSLLHVRADYAACIRRNQTRIADSANRSAERFDVPVDVLLTVAYLESHLGCANGSGGCWGAPINRSHRNQAGGSDQAAAALAWGYARCGSDLGAISHFRCGLCTCRRLRGYTPAQAINLLTRIRERATP